MPGPRRTRKRNAAPLAPDDLYDYARPFRPRPAGRPPVLNLSHWKVTDDWPERVPVTPEEIDVFEAWFGDVLDDLFGRA